MKKLSPVLTIILFGCGLAQAPISDNTKPNITIEKPLAKYQECMGYSDKTIIYTEESPGRYIVLAYMNPETVNRILSGEHKVNVKELFLIAKTSKM